MAYKTIDETFWTDPDVRNMSKEDCEFCHTFFTIPFPTDDLDYWGMGINPDKPLDRKME